MKYGNYQVLMKNSFEKQILLFNTVKVTQITVGEYITNELER